MEQLLKVTEWQGGSKRWHVADVHTWTGQRAIASVLDVGEDVGQFNEFLRDKYHAIIYSYDAYKDFLYFYWPETDYKNAHQFKLDVNRIARKKNYLVEKKF